METNYEELGGKEIKWVYQDGLKIVDAVVAFVDEDVGITIVAKDNPERKLACLNGPSSVHKEEYYPKAYKPFFDATVKMLKEGVYFSQVTEGIWDELVTDEYGPIGPCASGL